MKTLLFGEFYGSVFFSFGCSCVCLHGTVRGRPATFIVWFFKPTTIGDHALCHATVGGSTNLQYLKVEESRRLYVQLHAVVLYWRACSMYTPSICLKYCCHPQNRRRRTDSAGVGSSNSLERLLTTAAWHNTWPSIVSDLHKHMNAADTTVDRNVPSVFPKFQIF